MPFHALSLLCCHLGRRRRRGRTDTRRLTHTNGKYRAGGTDSEVASDKEDTFSDGKFANSDLSGTLSYPESLSLDDKLDTSINNQQYQWDLPQPPEPPTHTHVPTHTPRQPPSKQRSLRASFKLPVIPVQQRATGSRGISRTRTLPPVPAPRLVKRMRQRGPEPPPFYSQDGLGPLPKEPVQESPVIHRRVFRSTSKGLELIEECNVFPNGVSESSAHTKSLDSLLETKGRAMVEFDQGGKKSKYSRVVITASASTPVKEKGSLLDEAKSDSATRKSTDDERGNSAEFCNSEPSPSPHDDNTSIASYVLTPGMLSEDSDAAGTQSDSMEDVGRGGDKEPGATRTSEVVSRVEITGLGKGHPLQKTGQEGGIPLVANGAVAIHPTSAKEQPGKCRMIPIPTPPPSPPKAAIRPRSQPTTTLTNSFHAELPATAAPPSPARSPWSREKVADESVLGRTSRVPSIACSQEEGVLSPLQSPIPATSTKLDSSLTGSEISMEYSTVKKTARRKARKGSHPDQPPFSPPHTPPPLPPPLQDQAQSTTQNHTQSKDGVRAKPESPSHSNSQEDDDSVWETCIRCNQRLDFCRDDPPIPSTSLSTLGNKEPIYHVLERPLLCYACLKRDKHISARHLPCPSPPLPPRDFAGIGGGNGSSRRKKEHPLYESVDHLTSSQESGREESRRNPPISLNLRTNSSTDYESIPSLDTTNLDGGGRSSRLSLGQLKINQTTSSNHSSHDYESIDNSHIQSIDADSPLTPPYIPDGGIRNKFLKIDSQGYASVLYPHDVDDTWEFDCLNQDQYRDGNRSNRITVQDVEEAWKHQLEKGYAPLTVKQLPPPPPPLFSRTSSAPPCPPSTSPPSSSPHQQALSQGPEPRDYEVPLHAMVAPPPPPIATRRSSLMKQSAVLQTPDGVDEGKCLEGVLESREQGLRREESLGQDGGAVEASHGGSLQINDSRYSMRSRVMTAPATSMTRVVEV